MPPKPKLPGADILFGAAPTIRFNTTKIPGEPPPPPPETVARYQIHLDQAADDYLRDVTLQAAGARQTKVTRSAVVRYALSRLKATTTVDEVCDRLR